MKYTATFVWPYRRPVSSGPHASAIEHRYKLSFKVDALDRRIAQRLAYEQLEAAYHDVLLGDYSRIEGSAGFEPGMLTNPLSSPRLELHLTSEQDLRKHAHIRRSYASWGAVY